MKGKFRGLAQKSMWGLIILQVLIGIFSFVTLNIGRGVAVFGSAALIYLGLVITQQLSSIRELLSYSAVQSGRTARTESPQVSRESAVKNSQSTQRGRVTVRSNEDLA
jgi:hypothetical protein